MAPLDGIRILDLSRVLAGPYVGRLLADLGADVIKVEPPAGDEVRDIAPREDRGMSGYYTWVNVGKRNVSLDLARDEGRELLLALVEQSDALIENFRPGVAERLGIGWEAVHARNPRLVMVSINGFGSDSSWRERRAFAPVVHAASGILHDQASRSGHAVAQLTQAYADLVSGLHATVALQAALRARDARGEGEHVELAMFDAVLATYTELNFALLEPPTYRNPDPVYDAGSNGLVAVGGTPQHCWLRLSAAHPELRDPTPPGAELETKARLRREAIEGWMAARPGPDALIESLEKAGLAAARVATLREAATGPLARERELLVPVDDRRGGTRPVVRSPYRFSASECRVRGPAPRRGEHNAEVLREILGLDDARIEALQESGVLSAEHPDGR